jgi:putative endonuclease
MPGNKATGKKGEDLAASYLESLGYRILERNRRFGRLEIDLIALKEDTLHFIEVKTRRSLRFGHPEENVSLGKIERMLDAAEIYKAENHDKRRLQLDILSIIIQRDERAEFYLIEDVYL